MKKFIKMLVIALIGGIVGYFTNFPIGPLLGSLLAIGIVQFKTQVFSNLSLNFKRFIQALIGGSVGLTVNSETIQALLSPELWLVAFLIPFIHLLICILLAAILVKFFKFDMITALSSCAPAGIGEMVLLSETYNANQSNVITIHLFRMLVIIILIPIIVMSL